MVIICAAKMKALVRPPSGTVRSSRSREERSSARPTAATAPPPVASEVAVPRNPSGTCMAGPGCTPAAPGPAT